MAATAQQILVAVVEQQMDHRVEALEVLVL
jgi:hypothetical protein